MDWSGDWDVHMFISLPPPPLHLHPSPLLLPEKSELLIWLCMTADKSGADPSQAAAISLYIRDKCPQLKLAGLMTIGSVESSTGEGSNPDFEVSAFACCRNLSWTPLLERNTKIPCLSYGSCLLPCDLLFAYFGIMIFSNIAYVMYLFLNCTRTSQGLWAR